MATRATTLVSRLRNERLFFTSMALAILATILLGFAPTFYLRGAIPGPPQMLPLTPLVLLHGLLFSSWVLLFTTQTLLVNGNRTDVHRRLGRIGMVLLPAMIIVAAVTALEGVARKSGPPIVPPLSWLAVPLFDIPVFGALIGAALYFRSKPQVHKRLMLVAMIALLPPAIGRTPIMALWPGPVLFFGISDLFLVPLFAWDLKTTGRIQPVTLTASLVVIGSQLLRIAIWTTPGWLAFAAWASGLVT